MHRATGWIRTEILRAITYHLTRRKHPRKIFFLNHNAGVRFIVLQHDVVTRLVLLDQRIFQQQRVQLGFYNDVLDVGDFAHEHHRLAILVLILVEIAGNPVLQVLGLAHVKQITLVIVILINPRIRG